MLKKIIEPIIAKAYTTKSIKCPSNCKCSIAIKKIFEESKKKITPLIIQKEPIKPPPPVDRRKRCD